MVKGTSRMRQRLRQKRLAATRGADQQDVRLRQFDVGFPGVVQTFVMVVHRHREHALGMRLADHVIVENLADLLRAGHAVGGFEPRRLRFLADDVHAEFDAFIADEHRWACNQLSDFVLALAAE